MPTSPRRAMVLAAGLGERMRPLTNTTPKPLIKVAGKAMLDFVLDRLADAGVERAVVNVHYLADQIERHVAGRKTPQIVISDERAKLLDTGGGVVKALAELGTAPFFHVNSDTVWIDGPTTPNLARLAGAFDASTMDALLLLAPASGSIGYHGRGDFTRGPGGRLQRRQGDTAPHVYAGAAILAPALFGNAPGGPFSLTLLFDQAEAAGRLYGLPLEGRWMHVGTPNAIAPAEAAMKAGVS